MSNWTDYTFPAASSSLTQYSVVVLTTAGTVKHTTAVATAAVHGVLQGAPTSTAQTASFRTFGESNVRPTTDGIEVGNTLTAAAAGLVQAATASSAQTCIGFALETIASATARATNETILMHVNIQGEV